MKKLFVGWILGFCLAVCATAMGTWFDGLGVGAPLTDTKSAFRVYSTTKGAYPCPSMTQAQRDAITSPPAGLCVYTSDLAKYHHYLGGAWTEMGDVTIDNTQTLTNKTLTAPAVNNANANFGTATNSSRILLPQQTTAGLDALTDVEGLLAYDTTLNVPVYNTGSAWSPIGAGGGGVNVLFSDDFETGIANVVTSSEVNFTRDQDITTPIWGISSLRMIKQNGDQSGEYFEIGSFTTTADSPVIIVSVQFNYSTSANYLDDGLKIELTDGTNFYPIQPETIKAGSGTFLGTAQTTPGAATWTVRWTVNNTDIATYDFWVDQLEYGIFPIVYGIDTRGTQYDLTGSGTGSPTIVRSVGYVYKDRNGVWRMAFNIIINISSGTRTSYLYTLDGVNFKAVQSFFGYASISGGTLPVTGITAAGTGGLNINHSSATTTGYRIAGDVELTEKPSFAADSYPVQLGVDAGNRNISYGYTTNTAGSYANGDTIIFEDLEWADSSEYNPATGILTANYSRKVDVNLAIVTASLAAAAAERSIYLQIDQAGSQARSIRGARDTSHSTVARSYSASLSTTIDLKKGDTLDFRVVYDLNAGPISLSGSNTHNWIRVNNSGSGSNQMFLGEEIEVIATDSAGNSVSSGADKTWSTKVRDTHSAFDGTHFEAPDTRTYTVTAFVRVNATYNGTSDYVSIFITDSDTSQHIAFRVNPATTQFGSAIISTDVPLVKGQRIKIRCSSTQSGNYDNDALSNRLSIKG